MGKNKMRDWEQTTQAVRYRLKKSEEGFQVTREGEFEYHRFEQGKLYEKIPPEESDRFEVVGGGEER